VANAVGAHTRDHTMANEAITAFVTLDDTTTEEVHSTLSRLRGEQRGAVLASVLTLVVVAHDERSATDAVEMVRELKGRHPSRMIVLSLEDHADDGPLDAVVSLHGESRSGGMVWFEEILFTVRGRARYHLDSLITPFTLPDVPVVLWWPNTLPAAGDPLLSAADRILVDTRAVGERADLFMSVERLARRLPMADLSWSRLQPWRTTLATLFEGPTCRPFLSNVSEVQVSGSFGARHLMGGWLMDRLGLGLHQVQVGDAEHVRIRVYAEVDGRAGRFGVERASDARELHATIDVDDGPSRTDILPLPPQWASRALIGPLRHTGADPVYAGALRGAVDLLRNEDGSNLYGSGRAHAPDGHTNEH